MRRCDLFAGPYGSECRHAAHSSFSRLIHNDHDHPRWHKIAWRQYRVAHYEYLAEADKGL